MWLKDRYETQMCVTQTCEWSCDRAFPPGDGETDFVGDGQDPLQVLGAEGAGLPEGDAGGKALDDDRVGVVLDPLVRHLDRVLDAQCLPVLPVEQILDLLPQRVGQVDPGQFGLQALWRQKTEDALNCSAFLCFFRVCRSLFVLLKSGEWWTSELTADSCLNIMKLQSLREGET